MSTPTLGTRPAPPNGRLGAPPAGPVLRRRIRPARVLLGTLLALVLALAGVVVANRVDTRVPVLVAARDIGAGQTLAAADVKTVKVAADGGLAVVLADHASTVVGRVVAVPLMAGTLLSPSQFGGPPWPGAGQAVIAVPVKPGRLPSGLAAGARVTVLVVPSGVPGTGASPAGGKGGTEQATATVVAVAAAADQSGTSVVTLVLTAPDATRIAAAAGDVSLVQLGG